MYPNDAGVLAIALVVVAVVFLVLREFMCWYWKINQAVALLEEIKGLLAQKTAAPTLTDKAGP